MVLLFLRAVVAVAVELNGNLMAVEVKHLVGGDFHRLPGLALVLLAVVIARQRNILIRRVIGHQIGTQRTLGVLVGRPFRDMPPVKFVVVALPE